MLGSLWLRGSGCLVYLTPLSGMRSAPELPGAAVDTMAPSQDLGREHRTGGPRAGGRQGAGLLLPSREHAFLNRIPGPLQPHLGCC